MEVTFSPMERELLLEILEEHHRELFREMARTKHREFKHVLQRKEELLESMIELHHMQRSYGTVCMPAAEA
jgi:predicted transcriptional regulator